MSISSLPSHGRTARCTVRRSTASDAAARVSQLGAEAAYGSMTFAGAVEPRHSAVQHSEGLSRWQARRLRQHKARARDLARAQGPPGLFLPPPTHIASRPPGIFLRDVPRPWQPDDLLESLESYVGRCLDRLENMLRFSVANQEPGRGSRMSAAGTANVDSLAAPSVPSATPKAFVDAGRVSHHPAPAHGVLQGSLDLATCASEFGAESGHGSRMSATDLAGVNSLTAPPVSSAGPEVFVDAGHVLHHSAGGHGPPENAASVRAFQSEAFVDAGRMSCRSAEGLHRLRL